MHWKGVTAVVSSWQNRSWKSWRGLWMALSDKWCQSMTPSLVLYQFGRGTTDAIFIVSQLQEKYLAANKRLYMAFIDLEKAFDQVPRKVIWWALRKLGVDEWIVRLVQGMFSNARSRVRVGEGYSEGWCSPRLCIQPAAFHHCAGSLVTWVPLWGPIGGPLCWRPCYHSWITRGMCQKALDMERSNGGERAESKCRKDKDHDLWYGAGSPVEFGRVPMCYLSHWSGQQRL